MFPSLVEQARKFADEMFISRHPRAQIEHSNSRFECLVDIYTDRVSAADVGASTAVVLVFHWADKEGRISHTQRQHMEPKVRVQGFSVAQQGAAFAKTILVSTILQNLTRAILDAPQDYIDSQAPPTPIRLLVSRDPKLYAVSEPELLRSRMPTDHDGFLPDHHA